MGELFHSVYLDESRCRGCINCIKRCPTQAIRVRDGKANITNERCVDCGECIRVCHYKAKKSRHDTMEVLKRYEYTIALPPPSLYAQYNNIENQEIILRALLEIGFDAVYEVAYAAELVSAATRRYMENEKTVFPVISSACPVITKLIRVRYPNLIKNVLPLISPVELAAINARREAMERTGLPAEKIGCIFLTPCPSKVTTTYSPLGLAKPVIDAAISISEVYPLILKAMTTVSTAGTATSRTGSGGIAWAEVGGETSGLADHGKYLSADGVENIVRVLDDLESEKYEGLRFAELNACPGGCVGGVLQVENPYIARTKLKAIRRGLPKHDIGNFDSTAGSDKIYWDEQLRYKPVLELGGSRDESLTRYAQLQALLKTLPGLDCGSCGAPSCETFAEDVVRGNARREDCVVIMRERMDLILEQLTSDQNWMREAQKESME